jgi:hypothetical protein
VLAYDFPVVLSRFNTYTVFLPQQDEAEYWSTCGNLTQQDGSNAFSFLTGELADTCELMKGNTTLHSWLEANGSSTFNTEVAEVVRLESPFFVGEQFSAFAPNRLFFLSDPSYRLRTIFSVEPDMPDGLALSPSTGQISGTFLTPSPATVYFISLVDTLTHESKVVWRIDALEVLVPPVSEASPVSPAAYSVPVGVVLLCMLIVYLYHRNDTRKEYHIFISYRGRLMADVL